jgi:hypothetical protein
LFRAFTNTFGRSIPSVDIAALAKADRESTQRG